MGNIYVNLKSIPSIQVNL